MVLYNKAHDLWTHTLRLAQLTCPKEAMRPLHQFQFTAFNIDETETILPKAPLLAAKVSDQFVSAARKDLGYEALPLTAIIPLKDHQHLLMYGSICLSLRRTRTESE
jgi:hypothetical protein